MHSIYSSIRLIVDEIQKDLLIANAFSTQTFIESLTSFKMVFCVASQALCVLEKRPWCIPPSQKSVIASRPDGNHAQSNGTLLNPLAPAFLSSPSAPIAAGTRIPQQSPHPTLACTCLFPASSVNTLTSPPSGSSSSSGTPASSSVLIPSTAGTSDPNRKCCITGNFSRISLTNIFRMPPSILPQFLLAEMSSSMGLCHLNPSTFLTLLTN